MINPGILAQAERYRDAFNNGDPFRHVVMENFLAAEAMDALHREFPAFDARHALNEFAKLKIKDALFTRLGFLFKNRQAYRKWKQFKSQEH